MLEGNVRRILDSIDARDKVLDIGGWAMPFNRANHVLDISPFETRGIFGSQGPHEEHFSKETWIVRDLCDRNPFPFPDKYFDYVICSHTLEDIRDPIWVCSEINRIGKRGYIEVPSLESELSFGVENWHYAGRYHHRWVINIIDNCVTFTMKHHHIHSYWKNHLPRAYYRNLPKEGKVQSLFWENQFSFEENILLGRESVYEFYDEHVMSLKPYSPIRHATEAAKQVVKDYLKQLKAR